MSFDDPAGQYEPTGHILQSENINEPFAELKVPIGHGTASLRFVGQ